MDVMHSLKDSNAIAAFLADSRHEGSRKRILIGMSNTGGGHKASAEAIKAAFEERYGDKYEVRRITPMRFAVLAGCWGVVGTGTAPGGGTGRERACNASKQLQYGGSCGP